MGLNKENGLLYHGLTKEIIETVTEVLSMYKTTPPTNQTIGEEGDPGLEWWHVVIIVISILFVLSLVVGGIIYMYRVSELLKYFKCIFIYASNCYMYVYTWRVHGLICFIRYVQRMHAYSTCNYQNCFSYILNIDWYIIGEGFFRFNFDFLSILNINVFMSQIMHSTMYYM